MARIIHPKKQHGKPLTSSRLTVGTGVIGDPTAPMPSQNVYSAQSVLIIVHEAPSLIMSLDTPLGHGVAYKAEQCTHKTLLSCRGYQHNYTVLSLVAQCIVIGPVCGFVCGCVCLFVGLLP